MHVRGWGHLPLKSPTQVLKEKESSVARPMPGKKNLFGHSDCAMIIRKKLVKRKREGKKKECKYQSESSSDRNTQWL
jgi:hypothetical protein